MNTERKVNLIIDILPLIPYVVRGIEGALNVYNKMMTALKDGITDEEWEVMKNDRDAVLTRVIERTGG